MDLSYPQAIVTASDRPADVWRFFPRWAILLWAVMAAPVALGQDEQPAPLFVQIQTSMGAIVIELDREKAPVTCANFLDYVDRGFYDQTIFHRVIRRFMIQGGGLTKQMHPKRTGPPIRNEWQNGLKNLRGTIAMARRGGLPDSATCQFFVNVRDNPGLDQPRDGAGYAVFGRVVDGMEVVERIERVPTGPRGGYSDVPVDRVVIEKIVRLKAAPTSQPSEP